MTACTTQSPTHTSGCPVRHHFLPFRVRFTISRYSTITPEWTFAAGSLPTIPPHFVPSCILQDSKTCTSRMVPVLVSHVVGHWYGVCFMSVISLVVYIMHFPPLLFIRRGSNVGNFRKISDQNFHRPMETGTVLRVSHHEPRPPCGYHVGMTLP